MIQRPAVRAYAHESDGCSGHSNNPYFANIGGSSATTRLPTTRRLFGLGEKAGTQYRRSTPGRFPTGRRKWRHGHDDQLRRRHPTDPPPTRAAPVRDREWRNALLAAISPLPGGSANFVAADEAAPADRGAYPRFEPGHASAPWSTAPRAAPAYDPTNPIFGKTGTCTDRARRRTWAGSDRSTKCGHKLVVVVLLTGGRSRERSVASGIAGQVYRNLSQQKFFSRTPQHHFAGARLFPVLPGVFPPPHQLVWCGLEARR